MQVPVMKRQHIVLIIVGLVCFAFSIRNIEHKKLLFALKSARESAGLRDVGPDWALAGINDHEVKWNYSVTADGGEAKKCSYRGTTPVWEEDYFGTRRPFRASDGEATGFETITVHYDYASKLCYVRLITNNQTLLEMNEINGGQRGLAVSDAYSLAHQIEAEMKARANP